MSNFEVRITTKSSSGQHILYRLRLGRFATGENVFQVFEDLRAQKYSIFDPRRWGSHLIIHRAEAKRMYTFTTDLEGNSRSMPVLLNEESSKIDTELTAAALDRQYFPSAAILRSQYREYTLSARQRAHVRQPDTGLLIKTFLVSSKLTKRTRKLLALAIFILDVILAAVIWKLTRRADVGIGVAAVIFAAVAAAEAFKTL